jgi:hypothetical protein
VAGIVEAQEAAARRPGPVLEPGGLGPGHVRAEAAEEHHGRPRALGAVVGDAAAVGQREGLGRRESGLRHAADASAGP